MSGTYFAYLWRLLALSVVLITLGCQTPATWRTLLSESRQLAARIGAPVTLTIGSGTGSEYYTGSEWVPAVLAWVAPDWPTLPDASYIWNREQVTPDEALNGTDVLTFRHRFSLPLDSQITNGTLQVNADNAYRVSFNGQVLGSDGILAKEGDDLGYATVETYDLPAQPGDNEILVETINYRDLFGRDDPQLNPAGLIFLAQITFERVPCCAISGRITDNTNNPIAGVTVSTDTGAQAVTESDGLYTISGLLAGHYTLTPAKEGYTFIPSTRTVDLPPDATSQDFIGNTPPVALAQQFSVTKNQGVNITLTASDIDGDPLTYTIVSPPTQGSLSGTAPSLRYTPKANFVGGDSFSFKVNDGHSDSPAVAVQISVRQATPTPYLGKGEPVVNFCQTLGGGVVRASLKLVGLHTANEEQTLVLRGRELQVSAEDAKLQAIHCSNVLLPLAPSEVQWSIQAPSSSGVVSSQPIPLLNKFTPDVPGTYTIQFTACPNQCRRMIQGVTYIFPRSVQSISVTAVDQLALPPPTQPDLPALPLTAPTHFTDVEERCAGGGGVLDPQWVTVDDWTGPEHYRTLEGEVYKSRISRQDNFTNHDSQDQNFYVVPDPPYRYLLSTTPEDYNHPLGMGIEWERNHLPEAFRPTVGDRVAVFGYWIHDCGHDFYTEIHPPVGIAVQRPRPILLPSDQEFRFDNNATPATVGTNVYVPGIVTDIWFNRHSGEITNNCSRQGLHLPYSGGLHPVEQRQRCLPVPVRGGASPLQRTYVFNIYLPRNPAVAHDLGDLTVPLYYQTSTHPAGPAAGPEPAIEVIREAGQPTYLRVTLDLNGFTGEQYARQIVAGWVYPAPDNWGVRQWQLSLDSIEVHYDGDDDWSLKGDGDWRFWFNTNNGGPEWTKIFDCDGCVTGRQTFRGRPWRTGIFGEIPKDRWLGPDLLLFPDQRIWIHTSGFEDDNLVSDDTGVVNQLYRQRDTTCIATVGAAGTQTDRSCSIQSVCAPSGISGCASYTLNFQILGGTEVPATLSAAAQQFYEEVTIEATSPPPFCRSCFDFEQPWYPFDPPLSLQTSLASPFLIPAAALDSMTILTTTRLFSPQPIEDFTLIGIRLDEAQQLIAARLASDPQAVDELVQELRAEADQRIAEHGPDGISADLAYYEQLFPAAVWAKYFADFQPFTTYLPGVQGN